MRVLCETRLVDGQAFRRLSCATLSKRWSILAERIRDILGRKAVNTTPAQALVAEAAAASTPGGVDKYKILLDLPPTKVEPALGFKDYANALKGIIEESAPRFAVGIFGSWGSGKTTLMRTIEAQLDKTRTICVQFSAWRYEKEPHLIVPLLDSVREALVVWGDRQAENKAKNQAIRTASTVGKAVYSLLAGLSFKIGLPNAIEVSFKANEALSEGRRQAEEERAARVPRSFYHATFRALSECFSQFLSSDSNRRIVVFVDDLDRCLPNSALEVLESMKLFFDLPGFVFVVGLDQNVVEQCIDSKYGREQPPVLGAKEQVLTTGGPPQQPSAASRSNIYQVRGADYIKKIFQVPFALPPVSIRQIDEFIESILSESVLPPDQDQLVRAVVLPHLRYLVTESGVNPREIKRYINAFTLAIKVKPHLDRHVVLTLQTLAFRRDWEPVRRSLLIYRGVFTDVVKSQLAGDEAAVRNLDPTLGAVPESFLRYVSVDAPGAALLNCPSLDEYIYAGAAVSSSRGTQYLELIRGVAGLRQHLASTRGTLPGDWKAALSPFQGQLSSLVSQLKGSPQANLALLSLTALENWAGRAPTTPPDASVIEAWFAEAEQLISRALNQLMDLNESGSLTAAAAAA